MRLTDTDALIEKFEKDEFAHVRNDYQSGYNDGMFHAKVVADNFPTVDAVPVKHGKWIDRNGAIVAPFWERYECSECGARSDNSNYCPNCGARMDEDD